MSATLDRESLRADLRTWSDFQRRIALERVVDQLPRAVLEKLFDGLVRVDEHCVEGTSPLPSLAERVSAHIDATRQGDFLGELVLRNRHGEREPSETAAWLAATANLFDLLLDGSRSADDGRGALACLHSLVKLVMEVDENPDEIVVFEDDESAGAHFADEIARAGRLLG